MYYSTLMTYNNRGRTIHKKYVKSLYMIASVMKYSTHGNVHDDYNTAM